MNVLAIRHAATDNNLNGTFMGLLDKPCIPGELSSACRITSSDYGEIAECYSSPLRRARETAEVMLEGRNIKLDDRLIERDLGEWSGKRKADIAQVFPEAFNDGGMLDFYFTPPGGEPYDDLINRVASFLVDMEKLHGDSQIAVVTHNGVLRVMRSLIEGMPIKDVFAQSEKHLKPYRFFLSEERARSIRANPLLTI